MQNPPGTVGAAAAAEALGFRRSGIRSTESGAWMAVVGSRDPAVRANAAVYLASQALADRSADQPPVCRCDQASCRFCDAWEMASALCAAVSFGDYRAVTLLFAHNDVGQGTSALLTLLEWAAAGQAT